MSYIFWKLLIWQFLWAIRKHFLSILRGITFLLTQWDAYENSILHCVLTYYLCAKLLEGKKIYYEHIFEMLVKTIGHIKASDMALMYLDNWDLNNIEIFTRFWFLLLAQNLVNDSSNTNLGGFSPKNKLHLTQNL